jgi:hypothetical protein
MRRIFLDKILKNQKGAMDKILVTLLLVIIAVGGLIGLQSWISDQEDALKNRSENVIDEVIDEANG